MSRSEKSVRGHHDGRSTVKVLHRPTYGVAWRLALALIAIVVMFGGVGSWAVTAELAGAVISRGTVVVDRYSKRVQHRDGGIVAAINVKNGDAVEENAVLIRLDDTQVRSELAVIQSQIMELLGRMARLSAEQELASTIVFPATLTAQAAAAPVLAGKSRLFAHNKVMRESQEQQLRQRIEQLGQERMGYGVQRNAKINELVLIRKELQGSRSLLEMKLTPVTRVYALEREETRIDGDRGNLITQEARVAGQIAEIQQQILTLHQTARTEAQRELRTAEARINELTERQFAAKDKLGRMEIRAPQSGIVIDLIAHTVGGVISPTEQIMLIVPAEEKLAVEFKFAPTDIDQIRLGQDVRMRFTSFNQRTTPEVDGTVTYVSADISRDAKERQEYFVARAMIAGPSPPRIADRPITPGMPVEVFVTTDKRTALSYLVKPLTDQFSRAFRER